MTHDHQQLDAALSRLYPAEEAPESFETGWRAAVRREECLHMTTKKTSVWLKRLAPVCAAAVLIVGSLWAAELDMDGAPIPVPAAENGMVMMSSRSTSGSAKMEAASYDMAADTGAAVYGSPASGTQLTAQTERKLVRTADMTIRTQTFDDSLRQVQDRLTSLGGYVESLYESGETSRRISLYMRVPSEKLDEFLSGMEGAGRVTSRSESTVDMTTQYVDNQARLNTLYTKRDRLTELMAKAEDVADLIELENAVADTQYQIDSFETSQRHIDQQVDMSAVSLTLVEEKPSDTASDADLSLWERICAAFELSIEWTGEFLRGMLVFIVMILPLAVPAALIWMAVRLVRRKRKG